ncbi:DUF2845 domain-containing protein [Dyella tabacisoli]|uniref:DUF2845 domain-containing protein n=1 Tax=Dyella tabacisoli TaxID=2282381 RepID=A0A369UIF1_9GAMM|nr:DUF2845 domain-containing protein [Dyella tabacisoli]RDD80326.1 DUF2845 domain-containing protein [Dyella tabacisoli]
MLRYGVAVLLMFCCAAHAGNTLRVDSQVLTTGDSAARVVELLGKPVHKSRPGKSRPGPSKRGASSRRSRGRVAMDDRRVPAERWQYRHRGRSIIVTIVDGKVSDIDDRPR